MTDAMPDRPLLAAENVSMTFRVKQGAFGRTLPLHALTEVGFTMNRGDVLGLVGESGCGKSTLARILLGLALPTCGYVRIDGIPIGDVDPAQRVGLIQPIFQDPFSSLNPRKTVAQIVGLPLRLQGTGAAETAGRVAEMLERVGLPQRMAGSFPNQMSGGQRQRVAIARALISKPRIVICDEPTSALDVSVQSQILNLLRELQIELGLTYLLISHDLAVVRHMAHSVMVMYLGRIVEHAQTETLFHRQRHPYTRALLETVLPTTPGQGLPDINLTGEFPNPIAPPAGCPFHPRCPHRQDRCRSERPEFIGTAQHGSACFFPLHTA